MKVKELIEVLSNLDGELNVILQKDGEGNGYSPLEGADSDAVYLADSTWSGDVYSKDWSADDACFENEKEWNKFLEDTPDCVVLFPIN